MVLVQVPESLADDLCGHDGWRVALPTRSAAMDVTIAVLAASSNVATLMVAPEGIKASLETIRTWLRHHAPENSVEVHSPSVDGRIVIRNEADVDAAIAVIRAAFDLADLR
jgi:hypothetical protein